MSLSNEEKQHIQGLAQGKVAPSSGMEKHFVNVLNGKGTACSPVEKEWLEYLESEASMTSEAKTVERLDQKSIDTSFERGSNSKKSITERVKSEITEIEHRTDLTDEQKISRITHIACATCAGMAVQPIPFADIFILTPIQGYFGTRIAAIRGVPVSESEATDLIKEIVGIIGMGFIAQQLAIGIWKMVSFGAGGLLTIPLVYALSYAVMRVIDAYYSAKAKKQKLSNDQIKGIWREAFREGKKKGEEAQDKGELEK